MTHDAYEPETTTAELNHAEPAKLQQLNQAHSTLQAPFSGDMLTIITKGTHNDLTGRTALAATLQRSRAQS